MKNNTPRLDGVLLVFRVGFSMVLGGYKVLENVQRINGAIPLPASSVFGTIQDSQPHLNGYRNSELAIGITGSGTTTIPFPTNPFVPSGGWGATCYPLQPSRCPGCGKCNTCGR